MANVAYKAMLYRYFRERTKMEVPRSITMEQIKKQITIPNPGRNGGKKRECVSKELKNGYRNQLFTSYDYPESIPGTYIRQEVDPGNGEMHPAYLTICTERPLTIWGRDGWFKGPKEMDRIPRILLSQPGIANIRSIRESDLNFIKNIEGKFWLPSPTFANGAKTEFLMRYMDNGDIKTCNLYRSDGKEQGTACSILAVVVLDIEVKPKTNDSNRSRWLWE